MRYRLCYHLNLIIAVQFVLIIKIAINVEYWFSLNIHYKLSMICENTLETPLLVFFSILLLEWVDAYTRINYILQKRCNFMWEIINCCQFIFLLKRKYALVPHNLYDIKFNWNSTNRRRRQISNQLCLAKCKYEWIHKMNITFTFS